MIAAIMAQYDPKTVTAAAICTLGMFFGLTAYACFTKKDLTYLGGVVSAMTFVVFLVLILGIGFYFPWIRLMIILVVLLLTSFWIIYDT